MTTASFDRKLRWYIHDHFSIPSPPLQSISARLDNSELGGSDIESIDVSCKTSKGLLGSIRSRYIISSSLGVGEYFDVPDKGVDLDGVDIVELLQRLLDLSLVCLDVYDEDQRVVLLNLLHGALGVERVDDDLVLIKTRLMRNGLSWVFGRSGKLEGLGSVEGGRKTDLADLGGVRL